MARGEDTAALLGRVPLFADLSERDLTELVQVAVPRAGSAGRSFSARATPATPAT